MWTGWLFEAFTERKEADFENLSLGTKGNLPILLIAFRINDHMVRSLKIRRI